MISCCKGLCFLLSALLCLMAHAEDKAEGKVGAEPLKWHVDGVAEVRAYRTNWDKSDNGEMIVGKDGKLLKERIPEEGTKLNDEQLRKLHAAVTGKHEEILGAFCFFPHHALVFYDKQGKMIGSIDICFMCGNYKCSPKGLAQYWDLEALGELFKELKHPLTNEKWKKR